MTRPSHLIKVSESLFCKVDFEVQKLPDNDYDIEPVEVMLLNGKLVPLLAENFTPEAFDRLLDIAYEHIELYVQDNHELIYKEQTTEGERESGWLH